MHVPLNFFFIFLSFIPNHVHTVYNARHVEHDGEEIQKHSAQIFQIFYSRFISNLGGVAYVLYETRPDTRDNVGRAGNIMQDISDVSYVTYETDWEMKTLV